MTSVSLTNRSCLSSASNVEQLGASSSGMEVSVSSGNSSKAVLNRARLRGLTRPSGQPSTTWPVSRVLPRSAW